MRVAFYRARFGHVWDWVIALFSRGRYSHCELVFNAYTWFSSSSRDGGTRFKCIDPKPGVWDFLELDLTGKQAALALEKCHEECGCKYDWLGVFRFAFPFFRENSAKWFCSEVCAAALQEAGLLVGINPWELSPVDLYDLLDERRRSNQETR